MLILYGSQTGTTEAFAKIVHSFAKMRGLENVRMHTGDDYDMSKLPEEELIVFLTSTFYNGEFPDNLRKLWEHLKAKPDVATPLMRKTKFCVFGLGNSTTKNNFCRSAHDIRDRMIELGAKEILAPIYSDEYAANGHETAFRPWAKSLWVTLTGSNVKMNLPVHYKVKANAGGKSAAGHMPGFYDVVVDSTEVVTAPDYTDKVSKLVTFNLPEGVTYQLTDHVQIHPENRSDLVETLAKRLNLSLSDVLAITCVDETLSDNIPETLTAGDLLKKYLDITGPPSRSFLEGLSTLAKDEAEAKEIETFAEDMSSGNPYSTMTGGAQGRERFSVVDCLEKWKSVDITLENLMGNIPFIQPRFYSICSAPSVLPHQIQICFGVEEWSANGKTFSGLASGFLSNRSKGDVLSGSVCKGLLDLPSDSSVPLVGVALGTGVAVFRAILQHRETLLATSKDVSRMRLYYGMRHAKKDFLFEKEMEKFTELGLVELIPACSHDNPDNFETPGTKIGEFPDKVTEYFDNKGYYIYCGLGGLVPSFIEEALISAVAKSKGSTPESAYGFVEDLKSEGKWQVEAYSRSLDEDNTLKGLMDKTQQGKPLADQMAGSKMFCFQCGQTNKGTGCTTVGVCGKTPSVAALQDLIIDNLKRLSWYAHRMRQFPAAMEKHAEDFKEINRFTLVATFSTLTNVNFDESRMLEFIGTAGEMTEKLTAWYSEACKAESKEEDAIPKRVTKIFKARAAIKTKKADATDIEDLVAEGKKVGVLTRFRASRNDALVGLQEMLVYGLKGLAAYTDHSLQFGNERPELYEFLHEAFAFLLSPAASDLNEVLGMLMKCGSVNLVSLKLLHDSNNTHGAQTPGVASCKPKPGKAILQSGHDLKILGDLLDQCAAYKAKTGIHVNVYTHGEMLPAHGYPNLRASEHLAAHYGWAWQRQSVEFGYFPGPIIMSTNCLTQPRDEYKDRMFTAGAVGWPGIAHIPDSNYESVIEMAVQQKGFDENDSKFGYPENPFAKSTDSFNVGWGQETVIGAAGTVLEEVGKGNISRFYVIGGCDGYEGERSYYTDLAKALPETSVVLTVGCGKFRLNHLEYGTIGDTGIPRLLDLGQCNDSYSAVQIALALAGALDCGVNDLPLSIVLSWFEQKAVVVLLSLLSLGIQNIRVGPTIPAFLRPSIVKVLNEKFNLMPIGTDVAADIEAMTGGGK